MWSLVARTHTHYEGFALLYGIDATLSQDAPVEEGVTGPIGEFNEAKAFLGVEPLDYTTDRWAGGGLESGLAESGSASESTGVRLVGIVVEVTTPRMTKILLSHGSWGG
jgi:hypothetical protein